MTILQFFKMSQRRLTCLEVITKYEILAEVDRGVLPKKAIAEKYRIAKSTLSTIIKNRKKIEAAIAAGSATNHSKRLRTPKIRKLLYFHVINHDVKFIQMNSFVLVRVTVTILFISSRVTL